jgi:hypothetical protein
MTKLVHQKEVYIAVVITDNTYVVPLHAFISEQEAKKFVDEQNKNENVANKDYPQWSSNRYYHYYKVTVKDQTITYLKETDQLNDKK